MVREVESNKTAETIKFLCSYGGKILPRSTDGKLRYVGGLTRVLSVDRSISYAELMVKLGEFCGSSVILRCQLPGGDLETLISVKSDDDLANIIEEYERASKTSPSAPSKIRAILSPQTSLKQISPPPSAGSSPKSVDSPVTGLFLRRGSPPVGYPVGVMRDSGKAKYYHYHMPGNPRHLYNAPRSYYWQ